MELNRLPIDFLQEEHVYVMRETGQVLKGITGTLIRRLFPGKYDGVPAHVLKKAADNGTRVHEDIELAETTGLAPETVEGRNFLRLKAERGWKHLACEYLVSDMEHYATKIDEVFENEDGTVDIVDFKTTWKLYKDSVSWQLSVCARFFEQNNPGIKVRNLYAVWLKNEVAEVVQVPRQADEDIEALIKADLEDVPYEVRAIVPSYVAENEMKLMMLARKIRDYQEQYDALKAEIMAQMVENNEKSIDTGSVLITVVPESKKTSFDQRKFKEEQEEMYGKYLKETVTKASLKVTLRDS